MTDDMAALTATLSRSMTEDQLLTAITEAATLYGWRWHHVRRSDKALQQGNPGFPDLVLARFGKVLFLELKREGGRLTDYQLEWAAHLGYDSHAVYPRDLDNVLGLLK